METPQLERIEQVEDGWIKKYILTYRMPDGSEHPYEVASRKPLDAYRELLQQHAQKSGTADAVCIVAHTPDDTLVMIREFRYPLNSWCIAFPAGLIDSGEDILECASRELREETGYAVMADEPVRILPQAGFSSTGMTDEAVQVVFVEAQKRENAHTEPNELIEVFELPVSEVDAFLDSNELPIGTRAQLILERFRAR